MNKQEQWKLAAIIMREVDRLNHDTSEPHRNMKAELSLQAIISDRKLEYRWYEVIQSHRNRALVAAAKKARAS